MHQLDETTQQEFTEHLQTCEECRLRVQKEQELLAGIRLFGRSEMKHRLQQRLQQEPAKRFEWTQVASIAAAIVFMFTAVYMIRWFTDFEHGKTRSREIVITENDVSQRSLWITGKIIAARSFQGILSDRTSSFVVKQGSATQTISIKYAKLADLPPAKRTDDESIIPTFLEQSSHGLQLTLYTKAPERSLAMGVEAVSAESLIVCIKGQQIAYTIPGGWAGSM
jgi:NADH:ubiquinone oxidoreductase subunit 5 (subunit L)/multisubunit Na+/H+ antiporter MnhA subunit